MLTLGLDKVISPPKTSQNWYKKTQKRKTQQIKNYVKKYQKTLANKTTREHRKQTKKRSKSPINGGWKLSKIHNKRWETVVQNLRNSNTKQRQIGLNLGQIYDISSHLNTAKLSSKNRVARYRIVIHYAKTKEKTSFFQHARENICNPIGD